MTARQNASRVAVATPVNASDAASKSYVDEAIAGVSAGALPSYTTLVGNGTSGPFTITHNLNTKYVRVLVYRNGSPYDEILVRVEHTSPNVVTLVPDENWTTNQYRVVVGYIAQSDITAPTAPVIGFVSKNSTSVTVEMTTAATDSDSGVAGYYWWVDNVRQSGPVAASVGGDVTFSGFTASTSHSIKLTAVDNEGNESVASNVVTQTTDAGSDTTAPTAGTASFSSATQTSLTYTFTAGSDDVGVAGVDAYDADGTTLLASNVSSPWTRSGLTAGTSYGTKFRYRDAAGNFADSNTVTHSTNSATAISFIDARGEKTTSAMTTMPTHQAGDYLIMFAYRDGFVTPPTLPAGWTQIIAEGLNSNALLVAYKVAASSSEVSGAWTNSTDLTCAVYRGVGSIGASAVANGTGATITIPGVTLQVSSGSSWVVSGGGHRSGANSLATPPASLTYRAGYEGGGTEQDTAVYDTNGTVTSFTGGTINYATTSGWEMASIELKV